MTFQEYGGGRSDNNIQQAKQLVHNWNHSKTREITLLSKGKEKVKEKQM